MSPDQMAGNDILTCDPSLEYMVAEAIAYIREHEPPEGYYLGFSGGKDSIVVEDLAKRSGVKYRAFYSNTFIDPPELVKFIRQHYPHVPRLRPDMTFWQGIIKNKMMPMRGKRWCCDTLKKGTKASKGIPLKNRIMGLRAEESNSRASQPRESYNKKLKQTTYKPIFYWQAWHIWDYIKVRGLAYPSLYDEGMKRIGCVVCPFVDNPKEIAYRRKRWPQIYRLLDIYMDKLWIMQEEPLKQIGFTYELFLLWPNWPSKQAREYLKAQGELFNGD